MSYTDNVANFMGSIGELDGVSVEDLEAVAPDAIKKVRSQPNSPFSECFISILSVIIINILLMVFCSVTGGESRAGALSERCEWAQLCRGRNERKRLSERAFDRAI